MNAESNMQRNRRKGIIISLILLAALITVIVVIFVPLIKYLKTPDALREFVHEKGVGAYIAFVLLNILQTLTTVVPDGPFEIAAGSVFGTLTGTLLCDLAAVCGSLIAFGLSRKFGMRFVSLFTDEAKVRAHSIRHMTAKKTLLISMIFLIPGMPKDIFTYILGMSDMNVFLFILMIAVCRIPGIAITVMSGDALIYQDRERVIVCLLILVVLFLAGLAGYSFYQRKHHPEEEEGGIRKYIELARRAAAAVKARLRGSAT